MGNVFAQTGALVSCPRVNEAYVLLLLLLPPSLLLALPLLLKPLPQGVLEIAFMLYLDVIYSSLAMLLRSYFYMKDAFCCEFVVMLYWMAASSVAIGEYLRTDWPAFFTCLLRILISTNIVTQS